MTLRRLVFAATCAIVAVAAQAQQPITSAFVVGEEKGGGILLSEVIAVDAELSNDAVLARFGKLPASVPTQRWQVVRHTNEADARKARAEMDAKYRASGRTVQELK
ncbi:MAG: hypothetical protein IPM49_17590 [Flavobacteriales bacterium]|nr:hypothetical protein [Flavobacteriales bacterium]